MCRGRIYSLSPTLNPQGADIAKAMLVLKDKRKPKKREFYIHLANCAGEDKSSYSKRVQWVKDRKELLEAIGEDPIGHWSSIQELGVHKEKKTYYQFIACCMELHKMSIDPEHQTGIMLGLDSTSSGNQILAMLARDHEVAEYVNISMTDDGAPGDLYRYVGKFVRQGLQSLQVKNVSVKMRPYINMEAIKVLAELPKGHKTFRKITKRICMVLPYSGTRYGSGEITKEDQFDHGSDEVEALNFADCSTVGGVIYDQCVLAAKRSMGLMEYMRGSLETDDEIVTWRVPHTNFLAFQRKPKEIKDDVHGYVGGKSVNLVFYKPKRLKDGTTLGSLDEHKNAISPGIVHSLDAAMLVMIINGIPEGIEVSAIHDQFCVPMGHMDELVGSARVAYTQIADRTKFLDLMESLCGSRRELPEPGSWRVEELYDTDYFIC